MRRWMMALLTTLRKGSRRSASHGIRQLGTNGNRPRLQHAHRRRAFLGELKATVPIYPLTESTAEIIARIGGEQAAKGINLPLGDLMIGACALELGYAIGTGNARDSNRIPGLQLISL